MTIATDKDKLDLGAQGCRHSDGVSNKVKSSASPLPDVKEFDSSIAAVDDIVKALKITGGVILRSFLSAKEIDQIMDDVNPYLDADQPWGDGKVDNDNLKHVLVLIPTL